MMENYFSETYLSDFKKDAKKTKLFLISSLVLFALVFTLLTIFANYDYRILFIIIGCISCSIAISLVVMFAAKLVYSKDFIFRFEAIKNSEEKEIDATIVSISNTITLQNNDKVKEVVVKVGGEDIHLYAYDFVSLNFENNQEVKLIVSDDFIKGVKHEN